MRRDSDSDIHRQVQTDSSLLLSRRGSNIQDFLQIQQIEAQNELLKNENIELRKIADDEREEKQALASQLEQTLNQIKKPIRDHLPEDIYESVASKSEPEELSNSIGCVLNDMQRKVLSSNEALRWVHDALIG